MIRPSAKQSGIEQAFSETTKQQELGVAVHVPAKSGIWLILDAISKKSKRKAPYFKRSTVLFVLVEITGPIQITVTLLQSMHGALLGELSPHSFGNNKKGTTQCVMPF